MNQTSIPNQIIVTPMSSEMKGLIRAYSFYYDLMNSKLCFWPIFFFFFVCEIHYD